MDWRPNLLDSAISRYFISILILINIVSYDYGIIILLGRNIRCSEFSEFEQNSPLFFTVLNLIMNLVSFALIAFLTVFFYKHKELSVKAKGIVVALVAIVTFLCIAIGTSLFTDLTNGCPPIDNS